MEITKQLDGNKLDMALSGRVDSATAGQVSEALADLDGIDNISLDLGNLEFISSAGLRVLLATERVMRGKSGSMVLKNVPQVVMDVFEMTGFVDFLTIER